jgi:cellulose synthase/poly-beta-1,6-N-acetylglucosamine synthase-like glycosyltransferase
LARPFPPPRAQLSPGDSPEPSPRERAAPPPEVVIASIIIPARDEAARLPRVIEGVRAAIAAAAAPESAFELIVVDHGSCDRTAAVARALRATLVDAARVPTIAAVRNRGAARSRGALLAFLDADCVPAESWLRRAVAAFEHPDVVAAGYPPRAEAGSSWLVRAGSIAAAPDTWRTEPRIARWLPSANLIVRRSAFIAAGGFDESLPTCEDYDLTVRLRRRGLLLADPGLRVVHLREPATIRALFRKEVWRGRASLRGAVRHGLEPSELPSLALPFFHLAFATLLASALAVAAWPIAAASLALLLAPSLALAARAAGRARCWTAFPSLFLFFAIYSAARLTALAPERSRRRPTHAVAR